MEVKLSDLQRGYAAQSDEDLLALHARGTLTDLAYQAIEAELASRNIVLPPRPAPEAAYLADERRHHEARLHGLGGWLVLLGIGVVFSPIRIFATTVTVYLPFFMNGSWQVLTSEDSSSYHPLWGPIIVSEVVFNLSMIVGTTWALFLFFSKSYLFPRVYIAVALAALVFIPLDAWIITLVLPEQPMFDEAGARDFGRSFVSSLIWIPYLLNSRRVKATFVEGRSPALGASGG